MRASTLFLRLRREKGAFPRSRAEDSAWAVARLRRLLLFPPLVAFAKDMARGTFRHSSQAHTHTHIPKKSLSILFYPPPCQSLRNHYRTYACVCVRGGMARWLVVSEPLYLAGRRPALPCCQGRGGPLDGPWGSHICFLFPPCTFPSAGSLFTAQRYCTFLLMG